MRGPSSIRRRVRVCGPARCAVVEALVDTGASITTMTERLARALGIKSEVRGTIGTAGGRVRASAGTAKVCLRDPGCGCMTGPVAIVPARAFGTASLLVGQDYLEAARADIDCAKRSLRCRRPRRRR